MSVVYVATLSIFCIFTVIAAPYFLGKIGLASLYIFYIMMSQVLINIRIDVFDITIVVGGVMFAALSVSIDVMTEFYGKEFARKIINLGAASLVCLFIIINLIKLLPLENNEFTNSYILLFSNQNRVITADLFFSYFLFQKVDVLIFEFLRRKTKGRHLWLRGGMSTVISQTLIAFTFYEIVFLNTLPQKTILTVIASGLVIKYLFSFGEIPMLYLLKKMMPKSRYNAEMADITAQEKR